MGHIFIEHQFPINIRPFLGRKTQLLKKSLVPPRLGGKKKSFLCCFVVKTNQKILVPPRLGGNHLR